MSVDDLPTEATQKHGTRGRYVVGCRCGACRAANTEAARARSRRRKERAARVVPTGPPIPGELVRGGRVHKVLRCPGANGKACVAGPAWLKGRKVCLACVDKAEVWNGLVPSDQVRARLAWLSRRGVGVKQAARAAGVSATVLQEVRAGRSRVRAEVERKVLAVGPERKAMGALVPARRTWRLVARLQEMGFSKAEIARRIGFENPALQIGRSRVLFRTEVKVRRLFRQVTVQ